MSNGKKRSKKQPKVENSPSPRKQPVAMNEPQFTNRDTPVWLFSKCDSDHPRWSIKNCNSIWDDVISRLSDLEGQTWQEILETSGGRGRGTNNHPLSVGELCDEAQKRFVDLKLDLAGWDEVFSLRFKGEHRIFGLRQGNKFYVLWNDYHHQICKSHKKNT